MLLSCVICSDLLNPSNDVYTTPCGHIFHSDCLKKWLERSKTCPQCRNKCPDRHIHKIYFNLANLDTSNIDVGSLQLDLDNANTRIKELEKSISSRDNEITRLKSTQKTSAKTIMAIEKRLSENVFLVTSLTEQIHILKKDSKVVEDQKKEIAELREQIALMSTVGAVIAATRSDVDNMLKEENNPKTLSAWVAALKRELRICETTKKDIRGTLKQAQHEVRAEHKVNKSLRDRISFLESENYRMTEIIKSHENKEPKATTSSSDIDIETISSNSTESCVALQSQSPAGSCETLSYTPIDTNSPYLNIKSSSIGLTPLLKKKSRKLSDENDDLGAKFPLKRAASDLGNKYTIFKNPRLTTKTTTAQSTNLVFNGLGGSQKKEAFPDFPKPNPPIEFKMKSTISSRLKSGKLKKMPSTSSVTID